MNEIDGINKKNTREWENEAEKKYSKRDLFSQIELWSVQSEEMDRRQQKNCIVLSTEMD